MWKGKETENSWKLQINIIHLVTVLGLKFFLFKFQIYYNIFQFLNISFKFTMYKFKTVFQFLFCIC